MKKKSKAATRIIVIIIILIFITNVLLSAVLLHNSRTTAKKLIEERMLDIANCSAALINGDSLKTLSGDDKESPEYQDVYKGLAAFRDNINKEHLKYIYCVYQGDDGEFYFALDCDEEDPGEFGEKINHANGIYEAIKGTPSVDTMPYTDEWGTFYSAYSPVYDSEGAVVGLVVVDFDASWYTNQIASDMSVIIVVCVMSLAINAIAILLGTNKLRHNLSRLRTEIDILSDDISDLTSDVPVKTEAPVKQTDEDEISNTIFRIRYLQSKIRMYISRMKSQAFSDAMTGVGNRTAYNEQTEKLNKKIEDGNADFSVAIFDINGLKTINDEKGHDEGDKIIIDAASALKDVFGIENTYRIGGDEFIVIINHATTDEMESLFDRLDRIIDDINKRPDRRITPLYIAKGTVPFRLGLDTHFNDVFKHADETMYHDKAAFYFRRGDRRKTDIKTYLDQYHGNIEK